MIKAYEEDFWNTKIVNISELKNNLDNLNFEKIAFDETISINDTALVTFTDLQHPVTLTDNVFTGKVLYINKDFFEKNKEYIIELVKYICENKKTKYIGILDLELINDEIISSLCKNQSLESIRLGNRECPYLLKYNDYKLIKDTQITEINTYGVSEELEENFDDIIKYNVNKNLFGRYNYGYIIKNNSFYIDKELSSEEIKNLKFCPPNSKIIFQHNNYKNIFDVINSIENNNLDIKIKIEIENKNEFNDFIFNNIEKVNGNNVIINNKKSLDSTDFLSYIKYERRLLEMIAPALNLSPFEKFLYVYNIVKQFKKYKEDEIDKNNSRNLYKLLDNEYMVCVGYSKLLGDLLDKVNISNVYYGVSVNTGFDNLLNDIEVLPENVQINSEGHARRKVHLIDEKYGIDGIFFSDPTWDNDMDNDTYLYSLLTAEEYNSIKRQNWLSLSEWNVDELFFVNSLEEFYYKANLWMNRNIGKNIEETFIKRILSEIKNLDLQFYNNICLKYPEVNDILLKLNKEQIENIITEIGEYIVSKTNKPVTGQQYKDAITVLYKECYGYEGEELDKKVEEVIDYNKQLQSKKFPYRYMINSSGEKLPYENEDNKFDIAENQNKII